ncbi:class I SAM-dependent methyltransferase [Salinigranum marinum]|uniref:small ribosomal subunit Rsm22 family protein n=1 Tax=Salinigranum marinum TaxID=1515595 RepID=UPI002989BE74|nr:class I SAM-dependent methyltransferase [Salinigranum marinum]
MTDREGIRANAKYLREVRPIDPDEIYEYVDGSPHPAVVRQVLREEAVDLGLVERDDGTFVPAPECVVEPGWAPTAFPERYAHAFEEFLVEREGIDWHRGESGDRLRETIRRLKERYYRRQSVAYDDRVALGYGLYHLPDYYATVGYVLDTLAERGLVKTPLRVLDVGAGTGGPALGLHDFFPREALVDYHAVEPSAAADVLERLLGETGRNFHPTIHRTTIEALDLPGLVDDPGSGVSGGGFDLVVFSNVLSELDDPVAAVERSLDVLAPDGAVVALEPADLNTATALRTVEREVVSRTGATVYAPTLRLWPDAEPSDRGWSFDVRADLAVPSFQSRLDEAGDDPGAFTNPTVQFAYAVFRPDGTRRLAVRADPARHAKLADADRHVTRRVDLLAVKLSHDLTDDDDTNPVFKIGDGSESTGVFAVLTRETSLNEVLAGAPYGSVLSFEQALVLWNDDEGAYNLVVDDTTVVDFVG